MKSTTFLIKPASSLCDMRCYYCFYHDISDIREIKNMGIMTQTTAETLIQKAYSASEPGDFIQFFFQGGEPTLAGIDFFYNFLNLQEKYHCKNIHIEYSIQTNGLHLDEKWVQFLKKHNFLVGISLDGTSSIHDSYRIDSSGLGTWSRVNSSLELLDQYDVETNILCVVSARVAKHPQKVYASLKSLGNHPIQFIPCLDPLMSERGKESYSLKPDAYGKFLCGLFDCWYWDWKSSDYVSIRIFEDYLRILMNLPPSTCATSGTCGSYLVVESDGTLYPCDFYVLDEFQIGNIHHITVDQALSSLVRHGFVKDSTLRPENCNTCQYFSLCRGGCKRDWTNQRINYYCTAFKAFFDYSLPRLQEVIMHTIR